MDDGQGQPGGFCVVANVAEETAHREGGLDLRRRARHFAAGTKVWVLPPQWGDGGEQLMTPIGSTSSNIRRAIEFIACSSCCTPGAPCGHS